MDKYEKMLREQIGELFNKMKAISAKAKEEKRDLTAEEIKEHSSLSDQIQAKKAEIEAHKRELEIENEFTEDKPVNQINPNDPEGKPKPKPEAKAGKHQAESEEGLMLHLADMFRALTIKDAVSQSNALNKAVIPLVEAGHYANFGIKNAVDGFNTLLSKDGGIFLPTVISDRIMELVPEYGVFPRLTLTVPLTVGGGRQVLPNVTGELQFYAINQGSEAKASKFSFSGMELEELKWMGWVPWTSEMGSAAGAKLMPIIMRKIAQASAKLRDNAAINADGTSAYHNLKGLIDRSDDATHPEVRKATAATGHTSFALVDDVDFLNATLNVAPSIRNRGVFVLHPDWAVYLAQKKTQDGIPIYKAGGAISFEGGMWRIYNYPVYFTEAMPNTSGTSADYGLFFVPEYFAFGDVGAFTAEQFSEASILASDDTDGTKRIYLAAQDMSAIRMKQYFDFELSQLTIDDLGAFVVLETAAG